MRSIIRPVGLLATVFLAFGPSSTRSDDARKVDPKQAEAVDRVLDEWHQRASKITSLDVSFRSTQTIKHFGEERASGRLILASPNLAMLNHVTLDDKGQPTIGRERWIWSGRTTFQFEEEQRRVFRKDYQEESSPPSYLCLPFLFGMDPAQAKRDHDWKILRENQSQVLLKATPKKPEQTLRAQIFTKGSWFRGTFVVVLDKKSYIPAKVYCFSTDRDSIIYELADIKVNAKVDVESLKHPSLEGWKVKSLDRYPAVNSRFSPQLSLLLYLVRVWPR